MQKAVSADSLLMVWKLYATHHIRKSRQWK